VPTDAELLRRARRDPDGFVVVCERHASQLAGWLRLELRDELLAREVLAETFAEAWFAAARFRDRGDGGAGAWLHGIARNLVLRLRRERAIETRARARLGLPAAQPDAYLDVLDRLEAEHEFRSIADSLDGLPHDQRAALELRIVQSLEYGEVARRLAITPEAARVRVFRALRSLRAQMGERR
jgi:RNA polymerase sigma-70 factor (ECF subfamily)